MGEAPPPPARLVALAVPGTGVEQAVQDLRAELLAAQARATGEVLDRRGALRRETHPQGRLLVRPAVDICE